VTVLVEVDLGDPSHGDVVDLDAGLRDQVEHVGEVGGDRHRVLADVGATGQGTSYTPPPRPHPVSVPESPTVRPSAPAHSMARFTVPPRSVAATPVVRPHRWRR